VRTPFLRVLAAIYACAFASFGVQAAALVGSQGLLPAADLLAEVASRHGASRFWLFPNLAWISSGDAFLTALPWAGFALAAAAMVRPRAWLFASLWIVYFSVDGLGQDFFTFQWDALLLEAGFLAILFASPWAPSQVVFWLYRLLLFRLMFCSGLVKLFSGDPTWRSFTALNFHYETQPLPNPVAWYAHRLPDAVQSASGIILLAVELLVPFLLFFPGNPWRIAALLLGGSQVAILLTGNYGFFNFLTLALCLLLWDEGGKEGLPAEPRWRRRLVVAVAAIVIAGGAAQLWAMTGRAPEAARSAFAWLSRYHVVHAYGLFAVMTTSRPEIVIEGSNDGETWKPYEFRYKPGDPGRAPPVVAPHMPRVDWQLWFAALSRPERHPWFRMLLQRLLEGSPPVLSLLAHNPFPGGPPRYIRAQLYDYRFSRQRPGWWRRELRGSYYPAVSLVR
jgi:lipase maturation factor 1